MSGFSFWALFKSPFQKLLEKYADGKFMNASDFIEGFCNEYTKECGFPMFKSDYSKAVRMFANKGMDLIFIRDKLAFHGFKYEECESM